MPVIENLKRSKTFRIALVLGMVLAFAVTLVFNNIPQKAYAASIYWVGGASGDENNWNNANNWASSSGGTGGTAGVPTASDAVTFDNASAIACTLSAAGDAGSITNANYVGTLSLGANTLTVSGVFSYKAGSLNLGSGALEVTNTLDIRNTALTAGTSTIILSGATNSAIWGGDNTLNNLTISSRKNVPYGSASGFKVAGILNVANAVRLEFNLDTNVTLLKGASLNLNTSGELYRNSRSSITLEDAAAITLPTTGTIDVDVYFDAKTQDIYVQGRAYNGLYIRNASASTSYAATLGTTGSQIITAKNMRMYANGTGDLMVSATTYNPTVTLTSDGTYQYYFGFAGTGSGSEILNAGTGTWTIGSSDIDLRNGTLAAGTSNFIFNRQSSIYDQFVYSGGNAFNQITNANTDSSGLIFLDSTSATTFTYTSPVGSYKTQFQAGTTATFTNFNVSGQAGKLLVFMPYGSSAAWYLNVTNQPTVSYVSVSYSNAAGGATILATDGTSTDGGSNANWDFGKRYWVASSAGNWSQTANWSYSSGGTSGATLPATSSQVYFNSSGNNNCTINQDIDVASITVDAAYTATIDAAASTMNISVNFGLGGSTFIPGTSTLVLDGAAGQTLTANEKTFNIITVTNANASGVTTSGSITTGTLNAVTPSSKIKFDNTATFTVSTTFNVGGSGAGKVALYSNSDGNQWDLAIPADISKTYLDVKDSVVNHTVTCTHSTDSGNNNVNWVFEFALTDNLNGYWKLDDVYTDSSSSGDNGTNFGSTITAQGILYASGKNAAQAGASFDGNDYVSMGDPINGTLDFGTGSFSTAAWFKTSMGAGTTGRLISKGHWGWTAGYAMSVVDGKVEFGVGSGAKATSTLFNTSSTFNDSNWHLAVGVHDTGTKIAKIYVDGTLQNITQVSGTCGTASSNSLDFTACVSLNASNSSTFYLGEATTGMGLFTGLMDDPRVYSRAIATSEVSSLYTNPFSGTGNWSDGTYWATSQLPSQSATATIASGTATLDSTYQITNFQMTGGTLDFASGTLTATGDVNFTNGTTTEGTGALNFSGTTGQTLTCNGQTIYNLTSTNASAAGLTFADSCTVNGTLTDSTASSKLTFNALSAYAVNNLTLNGQAIGTKISLVSSSPNTQWLLAVSGTATVSYISVADSDASSGDTITANNGTSTDGGNNLNWLFPASNKYWVGATSSWNDTNNWAATSGGAGGAGVPSLADTAVFDSADSTSCTFDVNVSITSISSADYEGSIDASTRTVTLLEDLLFNHGSIDLGSDSWNVAGDINLSGSTVAGGSSTIVMTADGSTINTTGVTINDLLVRNSGNSGLSISLSGDVNIGGSLYLQANGNGNTTLSSSSYNISINGNIDYTGTGNGSEILDMGSATWTVSGNVDLRAGSAAAGTSTLAMNGTNKTIYGNNQSLYNFFVGNTIQIPYIVTAASNTAVSGTLTVPSGKELALYYGTTLTLNKGATLSIAGTISANGGGGITVVDPTTSTIPMTGTISAPVTYQASTQNIVVTARTYGSSAIISNTGSSNLTATLSTGSGQTFSINGSFQFYANGTGNLTVDASAYSPAISTSNYGGYRRYFGFFGTGSGSETLKAGSGTWTVGASDVDFRNGTLDAGTSTFVFNRDYSLWSQTVYSGGNSFYKITNANTDTHGGDAGLSFLDSVTANIFTYTAPTGSYKTQFAPGITATFTNFNVSGQAGKLLIFKPYGSNATWYLNVANQPTVSYTNPSYSNASSGAEIIAYDGTNLDGGNNTHWTFTAPAPAPTATPTLSPEPTSTETTSVDEEATATAEIIEETATATVIPSDFATTTATPKIIDETVPGVVEINVGGEISGRGTPGAIVEVIINGRSYFTQVSSDGTWIIKIEEKAGEYQAKVKLTNPDGSVEQQDIKVKVLAGTSQEQFSKNRREVLWMILTILFGILFIIIYFKKKRRKEKKKKS